MKEVAKQMMCTMMLPLRTVNFCYGLAIAFCNNPAIYLYQQLEDLTLRGVDYADSR
ncbi:hypothetical protein [Nostoc sp.]|uniref:hypothetical protein n=1 Tax=Nostoc sp. TaxID=1180 RepID=UPI0026C1CA04